MPSESGGREVCVPSVAQSTEHQFVVLTLVYRVSWTARGADCGGVRALTRCSRLVAWLENTVGDCNVGMCKLGCAGKLGCASWGVQDRLLVM